MRDPVAHGKTVPPVEILNHGLRFAQAAEALLGLNHAPPMLHASVPHYLLAHAVALMVKAYLAARGDAAGELSRLGHDLEAILAQALGEGLGTHIQLTAEEFAAIEMANDPCGCQGFEPVSTSPPAAGGLPIPDPKHLVAAARKRNEGLRQFCLEKTAELRPE